MIGLVSLHTGNLTIAKPARDGQAENQLQHLIKRMIEAQAAYNPSALDIILTSDYIEISPLGEVDPCDKVLGFYKPQDKPANLQIATEADEFSIRTYDKIAVVIARVTYRATMDNKPMPPRSIRVTYVCRQEKGAWKIASAQYTTIRPPQQPAKSQ